MNHQDEDLALLKDPDQWINWPHMPVKRYPEGSQMQVGIVVEDKEFQEGKPVVYEVNMFALWEEPTLLKTAPKHEYTSLEAMLADGWMCD